MGRAGDKLLGAIRGFDFDFRNKTVLDIGSSTGGFTELALKCGAKQVIAVEKGVKQMKAPLRFDERINLYEKTDIFDVVLEKYGKILDASDSDVKNVWISEVEVILADVSFVSLKKILQHAKSFLATEKTDLLVMMKPQFEAREDWLVRGVVKNEKMRREIIKNFENWLKREGFVVKNKRDNTVVGRYGNRERFYWLKIAKVENKKS